MQGKWPSHELPHLDDTNCEITSSDTRRYNCIAWAAGNATRNWWPDPWNIGYWPPSAPRVVTVAAFMNAYESLGYNLCQNPSLEAGLEKIAIYGIRDASGTVVPTHAALQLESGKWTSKLGPFEDVMHDTVDDVRGPIYGVPVCWMARPRN